MFEPADKARVIGIAPGADFPKEVVSGLLRRVDTTDPLALARMTLFVNTARMERRLTDLLTREGARFLPKIRLIPQMADLAGAHDLPAALPPLRRRLQLARLVRGLIDLAPDLAPGSAVFDLADSLAGLIDEMQGEGVPFDPLRSLDVANHSDHWARSLAFLEIVSEFVDGSGDALDREARQRAVIKATIEGWAATPPDAPILVIGSTGSRGSTAMLMHAVARLRQGAVILPGFDFEMPDPVWDTLIGGAPSEDHPQFRFARLIAALGLTPREVEEWGAPPSPTRNRLISLSLRPAPVTDQWLSEGPDLGPLSPACEGMTLIEAPSPRAEALAIAYRLRGALDEGKRAALISPDRMLTRQVTAALDQWGIVPDDSAGVPLQQTAPGRLLRQVTALFGERLTSAALLALLKHPLAQTGGGERGTHLRHTRDLELWLRRKSVAFVEEDHLTAWAARDETGARAVWTGWLRDVVFGLETVSKQGANAHLDLLLSRVSALASGGGEGSGALWEQEAGQEASKALRDLSREADAAGPLSTREFGDLIRVILEQGQVRSSVLGHPMIAIWGTLEARVQGAELVILGGLNDGVWPDLPAPDPWLNRKMRLDAGLLLPERRIGLSAHDFQQAIAAKEVILSRAIRDQEAETVPSRWLNRLTNLLSGLPGQGGNAALSDMRDRGRALVSASAAQDAPREGDRSALSKRPSPQPERAHRPKNLSVTQIQTLIRDPYAIYSKEILGLSALDPLMPEPDARRRGVVIHDILEAFVAETRDALPADAGARLMDIARRRMAEDVPWPAIRRLWLERFRRAADWFVTTEAGRRAHAAPAVIEDKVTLDLPEINFSLTARVDRIDRGDDGAVIVYDYKTGTPPTAKQMRLFDKQLFLEAGMVERGAFDTLGPVDVAAVGHIAITTTPEERLYPNDMDQAGETWAEFLSLIEAYGDESLGYTSRRAVLDRAWGGDYDHLARYGEWDETDTPVPRKVGR